MAQNKIKMAGKEVWQPDEGLSYAFETTYTSGSTRSTTGQDGFTRMFTVEQVGYNATKVPMAKVYEILQIVAKGEKFGLYYFSPFANQWQTKDFRVGTGDCTIESLKDGSETADINIKMTGCDPI